MIFFNLDRNIYSPGIEVPYSQKLFADLGDWRNQNSGLVGRVTTELALVGLALISLVEFIARAAFHLLIVMPFFKERAKWKIGFDNSVDTLINSVFSLYLNLYAKNFTSALIDLEVLIRPNLKDFYLIHAVNENRPEIVKLLLEKQWAINTLPISLISAAEKGHRDIGKLLLEKMKATGSLHQLNLNDTTPNLLIRLKGMHNFYDLIELNDNEKGYLELKDLAHWLSLEGDVELYGNKLGLDGTKGTWLFDTLATALEKFKQSDKFKYLKINLDKIQILQEALHFAHNEHSAKKISQRVQEKNLCFIPAGSKTHEIGLALYGSYMAIGNRGAGCYPDYSTLEVFKIDPALVTPKIVDEIMSNKMHLDTDKIKEYYYKTLPAKLSSTGKVEKDAFSRSFMAIVPAHSKGGHCSLAGPKAALRFAWAMLLSDQPDSNPLLQARIESKIFSDWTAVEKVRSITPEKLTGLKQRKEIVEMAEAKASHKRSRLDENLKRIRPA